MTLEANADGSIEFTADEARLVVDLAHGGRLAQLHVGPHQLLARSGPSSIEWGAFAMAPFAGRLSRGELRFEGRTHQLPVNMAPHAIHGTVLDRPWSILDGSAIWTDLGPAWPFQGRVIQRFDLSAEGLTIELSVVSDGDRFPAAIGIHPWFRRQLDNGGEVELRNTAGTMLRRGDDGLPDGSLASPIPDGPWDDCFTDVSQPIELVWPGVLDLVLESTAEYWVIFDERADGVCVEPQTSPPNRLDHLVEPGRPLVMRTSWTWRPHR